MYVFEGGTRGCWPNTAKHHKELPKILNGPLTGLLRIYALKAELVKNTVGGLNRENITILSVIRVIIP